MASWNKVSQARKRQLMRQALAYAGQLVRCVVDSYSAFDNLPDDERTFIDEYIVSIGDRLSAQADARDPRNRATARRIRRHLDRIS